MKALLLFLIVPASPVFAQTTIWEFPAQASQTPASSGLPDINADGVPDLVVNGTVYSGADGEVVYQLPGLPQRHFVAIDDTNGDGVADIGTVDFFDSRLFSGVSGSPLNTHSATCEFGQQITIAGLGDLDGDGLAEIVTGATSILTWQDGGYWIRRSSDGGEYCGLCSLNPDNCGSGDAYRFMAIDRVPDVDSDGVDDYSLVATTPNGGCEEFETILQVRSGQTCGLVSELLLSGRPAGHDQLAGIEDLNGDGAGDVLVIGYFGGTTAEARAYSGADLSLIFDFGDVTLSNSFPMEPASIAAAGDLNCDGFVDVLVGDPLDDTAGLDAGFVRIYSGADGSLLEEILGVPGERLGYSVDSAGDMNADGVSDWLVSSALFTRVIAGAGPEVASYCVGKLNSEGCVSTIFASGLPSLGGPDDFLIRSSQNLAGKAGLFFWGRDGQANLPFLGGTLCVQPPLVRTPIQVAQGQGLCGGSLGFFFSQSYAAGANLNGGDSANGQFWMRDPNQADGTGVGLSNAIEFSFCE